MPRPLLFVLVASAALVVGGAVLILVARAVQPVASFGWFAYQPLAGSAFMPGGAVLLTTTAVVGATLAALGFAALAGVVGFALGRRRRR